MAQTDNNSKPKPRKVRGTGTYVGDEEANTIDYVASYNDGTQPNTRLLNALEYLDTPWAEGSETVSYLLTNVDE